MIYDEDPPGVGRGNRRQGDCDTRGVSGWQEKRPNGLPRAGRLPKSCHRMAAMGTEFPWRWGRGTISANLDVIWGMSVENSLLPEAKVLIFGSAFTASEPWVPAFRALRRSYGETTVGELTGDRALASVGYKRVNTIHSQWTVRVTEEHLVKNTLSYGSCTKNVLADLP